MQKRLPDIFKEHLFEIYKIILSATFVILSLFFDNLLTKTLLCLSALVIIGYEYFIQTVKGIIKLEFPAESILMVSSSIIAFILGDYIESVLILLLFTIGELFEDIATDNSKNKILSLGSFNDNKVRLITENGVSVEKPENININSKIEIRKGDRVTIDGILLNDIAVFDLKSITGESKPYELKKGDKVISGAINVGETVCIKTDKLYKDSTIERIIEMVEGASAKKSRTQNFISSFARVYTPIVFVLALILATVVPLFDFNNFSKWIYRALTLIVVSCPCALVVSVPLAYFIGIGNFAKQGILCKGSNYIDILTKVKNVYFDKTGTLTKGNLIVKNVNTFNGFSQSEVLLYASSMEEMSSHPIADAIKRANKGTVKQVEDICEKSGYGLIGRIDGHNVIVGNRKLLTDNCRDNQEINDCLPKVFVEIDGKLAGVIFFEDEIKENCKKVLEELKALGICSNTMVSGDSTEIAREIGDKVGMDVVYGELLPQDKAKIIEKAKETTSKKVMYVGDGINDSMALVTADVGVAMGKIGSSLATESADIVLVNDNLEKLPYMIKNSKKIRNKAICNIIISLIVKFTIILLGIFIKLPIWLAMFADVGVLFIVIINSMLLFEK